MKPSSRRQEQLSATLAVTLCTMAGCFLLLGLLASASDPSWWRARQATVAPQVTTNSGVVTTNYTPNDYAVATEGQLKQFTARAVDELNADSINAAGTNLSTIVSNWAADYRTNGYSTNVANPTQPYKPSDFQAVNVGQLKYIGNRVWARLVAIGYTNAVPSWLALDTNTDNTAANLGQLKEVFNFSLAATPTVSLAGGTYGGSQSVTLSSSTSGATIYYTIDGTMPTVNSMVYSGPIAVTTSETIKFIATAPGYPGSAVGSAGYTITSAAVPAIFQTLTSNSTISPIASFSYSNGSTPEARLLQASDGNFYGTTEYGGSSGAGLVFKLTSGGILTTLYSFSGSDGSGPMAELIQGSDGNFYGTTAYGGSGNNGTVFKLTPAGSMTILHSFTGTGGDGASPRAGLIQASDGNLYGTTIYGGANYDGTIFKISTSGALSILHSFSYTDGSQPADTLIQGSDGNLYGTTLYGGGGPSGAYGTVFKVGPDGALTTLYSFQGTTDGSYPRGGLVQAGNGNFYGTTTAGGSSGKGAIFEVASNGSFTSLYSFTGLRDGSTPDSGLVQGIDGNFYGTTYNSGDANFGTIFQITPAGVLTTLHSFAYHADGASPYGGLIQGRDGSLYGTSSYGGTNASGIVFQIAPFSLTANVGSPFGYQIVASNSPTTYNATGLPSGLSMSSTGLITGSPTTTGTSSIEIAATNSDGTGTVTLNLTVSPSLPAISSSTTISTTEGAFLYTIVASNNPNQYYSAGLPPGITLNSSTGVISGSTTAMGTYNVLISAINSQGVGAAILTLTINPEIMSSSSASGMIGNYFSYRISAPGNPTGYSENGSLPPGLSFDASSGYIEGTPTTAGAYIVDIGAIYPGQSITSTFKITIDNPTLISNSIFSNVHSFNLPVDGGPSVGGLVQDSDGNLFGTTNQGGSGGQGTIFTIAPSGTFASLYSFSGSSNGERPNAGLVKGSDGNFYGTTIYGGSHSYGTIFKVSTTGALTTLYSFSGSSDGSEPSATLVLGSDGNLYGTTYEGGTYARGTIFKATSSGALTTLYSFTGFRDGGYPNGLMQASDGNFYGTASSGGSWGEGSAFKITPGGAFANLYSFTGGGDGGYPESSLVQGSGGNFYGTTSSGGSGYSGTVFQLAPDGAVTTLYSFIGPSDGRSPKTALIQASDGNLYGTASSGGSRGFGTLFGLAPSGVLTVYHSFGEVVDSRTPNAPLIQGIDGSLYGTTSTGGESNANGTIFKVIPFIPAPTIVPNGGAFGSSTTVTFSGTPSSPAVVIHYTLDGSTPTTSSSVYSAPFTLSESRQVSAAFFFNNSQLSAVASVQFYIGDSTGIGISDAWQDEYFGNLLTNLGLTATTVSPGGLTYLQDYLYGYSPLLYSTNGDGLSDSINFQLGYAGNNLDINGYGLTNAQQLALGLDPFDAGINPAPPTPPTPNPSDHTAPVITLTGPQNATLLP